MYLRRERTPEASMSREYPENLVLGKVKIPRLMLGTSPFIGAGQFGARSQGYYEQFSQRPENMVKLMVEAAEFGINWVQAIGYDRVGRAVEEARCRTMKEIEVAGTVGLRDFNQELELMKSLKAKIIFTHASVTDRLDSYLKECIERISEVGIPGVATHNPGRTIPTLEDWERIEIIMAPINKIGRYMVPSPERALEAISNTKKVVIGKKVLAAGQLDPEEALEYVAEFVYGVAIGITSWQELVKTFCIAKRIWNE